MNELGRDIKFGIRQLAKSPALTVAAVLCLGLGIGANSAAFSFVRSLLFQTAPVQEPERLVRMYLNYSTGLQFGSWSYPDLIDMRETSNEVFSHVTANAIGVFSFSAGDGTARRLFGSYVTGDFFEALGIQPALGRAFLPEEDATPGTHPVAVLAHSFWQESFGGDPDIVGRSFLLNGQEITAIGVAPADFRGADTAIATALWVPFQMEPPLTPSGSNLERRRNHWIGAAIGRLQPGVTAEQAKAAADAYYERTQELYPDSNTGITIDIYPESEAALHPAIRDGFVAMLSLLSAVVAFVLLLACANVAGLLAARSSARQREMGIRLALGAGRARLVRQLLTESLILAALGGGLGVVLGLFLIGLVQSFQPPTELPLDVHIVMDSGVLATTMLVTLATGLLFGLVPALMASRQDLVGTIKDGAVTAGGRASRLRRGLVVGQVALCLVLLIAAGMVLRALQQVRSLDLGFDPDGMVTASVDPALHGYGVEELPAFFDELRRQLLAQPGITSVGYAQAIPLSLMGSQRGVLPQGYEVPEGQDWPSLDYNEGDEGYFAAMGIPILRGRAFEPTDDRDGAPVAIVNEAFVERFWPGESGVGKLVEFGGSEREVVGVVPTGKYFSLGENPKPYYYGARRQLYQGGLTFIHVRTAGDPTPFLETVRRTVAALDPTLPVSDLNTGHGTLGLAFLPAQMAAGVIGSFALLALLLAAVGLYGVVSFTVSQGVRDIGVRMALGARAADVVRIVVRQGMTMVAAGLALGVGGGYLLSRAAAGLLYGTSPTDPVAYLVAVTVLGLAALIASLLPARRATRIDPLVALRSR